MPQLSSRPRRPWTAAPLLCLPLLLIAAAAHAQEPRGFDDAFAAYADADAIRADYSVAAWASRGTASGDIEVDAKEGLVGLTASTQNGKGDELPAFTLVSLIRREGGVRLGAAPDVEVDAVVQRFDAAPFGENPISPVSFGLGAPRSGVSVLGQVGIIGRGKAPTVKLMASIEVKADGDKALVAERVIDEAPNPGGGVFTLSIQGDRVDLLLDGESLVGGPAALGVDLEGSSLGTTLLSPMVQVRKTFGKRARTAELARFAVRDATDADAALALLPVVSVTIKPGAGGTLTPELGEPRALSPHFIGFNGNLSSFNAPWSDAGLVQATRSLNAATVRYPAGSIGNVWDWDRGWVLQDIDYTRTIGWVSSIRGSDKRYTLENLAEGFKEAGFEPVYVMNMIHHTLDEQVGHLKRARAAGASVKLVELGNEYYFGRGADAYMNDRFATAADYGREANRWAKRIKEEFPGVRVAACGSGGGSESTSERRRTWNDVMVPVLDGSADAITIHKYAGHGLDGLLEGNDMEAAGAKYKGRVGPPEVQEAVLAELQTAEGLAYMLTRPAAAWREMLDRTLIPDMPIWLTEFNMDDQAGPVRNTWAHALFIAASLDAFLSDPRVELVHFHNLIGGDLYPALWMEDGLPEAVQTAGGRPEIEAFDATAGGLAMRLFAEAMHGATEARPVRFAGAPSVSVDGGEGGEPLAADAVWGWSFGPGAVLVNQTDAPVEVTVPGSASGVRVLHAAPAAVVAGADSVRTDAPRLGPDRSLTLPAHAVAVVSP